MSQKYQDWKSALKYDQLSEIDEKLLTQIKLVFIFIRFKARDVIFITNTDQVYGFGSNKNGRLGFGHIQVVKEPTIIPELCSKNVTNIQFGSQFMVALTQSGDVYTCGYDSRGMLGNGNDSGDYRKPEKLDLSEQIVVDIKCCAFSTFLLTKSNQIYWFGYRPRNNTSTNTPIHKHELESHQITQMCCGSDHILALTTTGSVYAWGWNNYGQLGLGHHQDIDVPQVIKIGDNDLVKQISCGDSHSFVLTTNGDIYLFGFDCCRQKGEIHYSSVPKLIGSQFTQIHAFDTLSMALSESQRIMIWGQTKGSTFDSFQTDFHSFQEAINTFGKNTFTYKPLSSADIFLTNSINRVIQTMAKAFNNPKNSDLKFKVKRRGSEDFEYIYGHKWFVEENSEHFETMFANNWSESETNEIEINGYSYESYYQFIRYLYTDFIETEDMEELMELFAISEEYLDEKLKTKCVKSIKSRITDENVCSLYSSAIINRSKELEDNCFEYLSKNINSITKTDDFERMDSSYAKLFFSKYFQNK